MCIDVVRILFTFFTSYFYFSSNATFSKRYFFNFSSNATFSKLFFISLQMLHFLNVIFFLPQMSHVVYGPGLIFGSGSLVLGVWTFFLPETANRQLPQSLRDMNNWSKQPKTTRDMCTCCRADSHKEAQDDLIANNHK